MQAKLSRPAETCYNADGQGTVHAMMIFGEGKKACQFPVRSQEQPVS